MLLYKIGIIIISEKTRKWCTPQKDTQEKEGKKREGRKGKMREKEDRTSYKCFLIKCIWKTYFYIHRNKRTGKRIRMGEYRYNGT